MTDIGFLKVKAKTWNKKNKGLYDHKSDKPTSLSVFTLHESSGVFEVSNNHYAIRNRKATDLEALFFLEKTNDKYFLNLNPKINSKMWQEVPSTSSSKNLVKLNKGSVLRVGRVNLRVLDIPENPIDQNTIFSYLNMKEKIIENQEEVSTIPCRICLNSTSSDSDPLIGPCNCSGSIKNIHLNCLKQWIDSKVSSKISEKSMSLFIKDLSCEICKVSIPLVLSIKGQNFSLLNILFPKKQCLILEELVVSSRFRKALHLVFLQNKESSILGRSNENDLEIDDLTVSRDHCKIVKKGSDFFLEDLGSKYGSFILLTQQLPIDLKSKISIQIGTTTFEISHSYLSCFSFMLKCFEKDLPSIENAINLTLVN